LPKPGFKTQFWRPIKLLVAKTAFFYMVLATNNNAMTPTIIGRINEKSIFHYSMERILCLTKYTMPRKNDLHV